MSNIKHVFTVEPDDRPPPNSDPSPGQLEINKMVQEWTARQAKEFFRPEEYGRAFEFRRSKNDDDAVIQDYLRTEQPEHPIPRDDNFNKGLQWVRSRMRPSRVLHPVAFPDLRYYPITINTNVEAPWSTQSWEFIPKRRNVDLESTIPRVSTGTEDKYYVLYERYEEWRNKQMLDWLAGDLDVKPTGKIPIQTWLAWKQQLDINQDNRRIKHNLYPEIFEYNRFLVHQIKDGDYPFWSNGQPQTYYWNTVHMRSHVVGPDEPDKIRAVFGATWLLLMCELMFIWPLQSWYANHEEQSKILWGHEIMRGGWRKLQQQGNRWGLPSTLLSVDWSEFDRRLLHELMCEVFDIWKSYFDFSHYEETSFYNGTRSITNPHRINNLWNWVCNAILHTPALLPDGRACTWTRNGFGSGYQMTQLMDTFANAIMICTCLTAMGVNIFVKEFWIRLQGDDSIASYFERMFQIYGTNFLDMLAAAAKHYFNAKLSQKKSRISSTFEGQYVLGYLCRRGLPYRTTEDLLSHLLYPESRFDSFDRKVSVTVGLAYATCGTNLRMYQFLKFIFEKMMQKGATPNDRFVRHLKPLV